MDELRDYRYYAADMLHPSDVAVDYIFSAFSNAFFDKNTLQCMHEVNQYQNSVCQTSRIDSRAKAVYNTFKSCTSYTIVGINARHRSQAAAACLKANNGND